MYFNCGNDTKIIQHLICLIVWFQTAENLTELTHLGQNVTINCDLEEKEIYWLLLKLPNHPVIILRLFSTSPTPFYYDLRFRFKYSVQPKYRLFIKNVTTDDLGFYYCMTTEAPPKFSNGIKLHITEPTKLPECQSHTVVKYIEQNHTVVNYSDQIQTSWVIAIIVSGLMHAVLVFVVIGYACCYSREGADSKQTLRKQLKEPKTLHTEVVFSQMSEDFEQNRCFSAQIVNRNACS